ncbi:hypothetical protein Gasu2_33510 [Galdieria sulphuraria]|nr:hypothetical protein Gasu2_33510 [Galdieria sulphuraria]
MDYPTGPAFSQLGCFSKTVVSPFQVENPTSIKQYLILVVENVAAAKSKRILGSEETDILKQQNSGVIVTPRKSGFAKIFTIDAGETSTIDSSTSSALIQLINVFLFSANFKADVGSDTIVTNLFGTSELPFDAEFAVPIKLVANSNL